MKEIREMITLFEKENNLIMIDELKEMFNSLNLLIETGDKRLQMLNELKDICPLHEYHQKVDGMIKRSVAKMKDILMDLNDMVDEDVADTDGGVCVNHIISAYVKAIENQISDMNKLLEFWGK